MRRTSRSQRAKSGGVLIAALLIGAIVAPPAAGDETVRACGNDANNVFAASAAPNIAPASVCGSAGYNSGLALFSEGNASAGQTGRWQAVTPAGLELVGMTATGVQSGGVNDGQAFGGGFYWAGGGIPVRTGVTGPNVGAVFPKPSTYFGMQLICGKSPCRSAAQLEVAAFSLYVRETTGPSFVAPTGLWQASGWIRGTWPFFAWGNSPSGLCSLSARLNGQLVDSTSSPRDVSQWHQCATGPVGGRVDTSRFGQGAMPLTLSTGDAAGVPASVSKTIYVDNSTPVVSMGGPTDAPSTAGPQVITAHGSGSPSGIADLVCSVDGGRSHVYPGTSARVAVSGIGEHVVRCYAENNAVDPAGTRGRSAVTSWPVKIGQPTVAAISFNRIVGLRCHRVQVSVRIPGRWITIRRRGHRMRVKTRAHRRVERVTRCHPRTAVRRTVVFVPVRRHGHVVKVKRIKHVRVVVPPHVVAKTSRRVPFGRRTTVNGWLGTSTGTAIGGAVVHVLSAPDDQSGRFTEAATVRSDRSGAWRARLPAGPSRIVEAVYDGDSTTERATSAEVHVIVPARIKLTSVSPRRVPWGGTVHITGRLLGGFLPPGGALVRLRIGFGHSYETYGVREHVGGHGRFTTTYTFGAGEAGVLRRFFFQIATLPMGDYPYAPANSGKRTVLVGGHG
jgi:hypothetical protein